MPATPNCDNLYDKLLTDVRFEESLNACMNCGICTAICPAAEFFEYDPRSIVTTVQTGSNELITFLLESDTIWLCGQCMSCKTRCPRSNSPGVIISVLRKLSQETGAFVNSRLGRKQYLILKTIGENILKYGYTIHPSVVLPEKHPEQGPVWEWIFNNRDAIYQSTGANLDGHGAGALRKIPQEALTELKLIFDTTGGTELFNLIEEHSIKYAQKISVNNNDPFSTIDKYLHFIENE